MTVRGASEPDSERRIRLALDEARAHFRAGEIQASAAIALEASELAGRAQRPDLIVEAALVIAGVPDPTTAAAVERMSRGALARLGPGHPELQARLRAQLAVSLHHREQFEEAERNVEQALALADRSGDPTAIAAALHAQGLAIAGRAKAAELLEVGNRMLAAALAADSDILELLARTWRIDALMRSGETAMAGHEIDALAVLATRSRAPLARWNMHLARAGFAQAVGRFNVAEEEARTAREVLPVRQRSQTEPLFIAQLMLIATDRGIEPPEMDLVRGFAIGMPLIAVAMMGRYDVEVGDLARGRAALEAIRPRLGTVQFDRRGLPTLTAALELAVTFGDATLASDLAARLEPFDGSMIASALGAVGPVSVFLARVETFVGRHDAAVDHAQAAITVSARSGFGPWLARSRLAHADALIKRGGPGDRDLARNSAALAATGAEQLGMSRLLSRARSVLDRIDGRDRLSPRELEIAGLVAEGSTNKQIATALVVSDRTVETHVQNILGKLGFHSRAEIAAWAVREGILPPEAT